MTVLIIPSWYRSGGVAQLGAFFREQALALKKHDINVIVADATLQGRDNLFSKNMFRMRKFDDEGLTTYSYITPAFGAARTKSGGITRYYRNLRKIIKRIEKDNVKIDLIHAHASFPAGYAATKIANEKGIPVVVTEHSGGIISKSIGEEKIRLLKETVEKADEFICVSEGLKKSVISQTGTEKNLKVIPNMVSEFFFPSENRDGDSFTYVSIGNLIKSKRFDLTLTAFANAFSNDKSIKLTIIGDGYLKNELSMLAQDLNIADQVEFTGRLDRLSVAQRLRECDVFVLPSDFETFGVVYIEALASGLPVIGTRNGGANDIITEDNGILVDVDNIEQLTNAMKTTHKNIGRFNKRALSKSCFEKFGEDSICLKIKNIYESVSLNSKND